MPTLKTCASGRRRHVKPTTVSKFPRFTAWCSESTSYVRVGCPILVQKAAIREHLCNYCATRISTVYHADVRPSRALTMARDRRVSGILSSHLHQKGSAVYYDC